MGRNSRFAVNVVAEVLLPDSVIAAIGTNLPDGRVEGGLQRRVALAYRDPGALAKIGRIVKSRANEGELRRTRILMDKISGKTLAAEGREKIETII